MNGVQKIECLVREPDQPSRYARVELVARPSDKGIHVISRLRSGRITRFDESSPLDQTVQAGHWRHFSDTCEGSEGLVLRDFESPSGPIVPIETCESLCFSGVFAARRALGIRGIEALILRVEGRIDDRQPDSLESIAWATSAAVIAAVKPDADPVAMLNLPWKTVAFKATAFDDDRWTAEAGQEWDDVRNRDPRDRLR